MAGLAGALAARGRWLLIAGLAVGLASPAAAAAVRPHIGALVIALLFLAMLRIGPAALRPGRATFLRALAAALVFQMMLPLALAAALKVAGLLSAPVALALVLILAAAPITGAAPITVMAGGNPGPALHQTVIGTALLPLTVLPVFALAPAFGDAAEVFGTALRLLAVVGLAGGAALFLRRSGLVAGTKGTMDAIDAGSAILLALAVVGLMSAAAAALRDAPGMLAATLLLVGALCFGLQGATARLWPEPADAVPLAVAAGSRNVALFLGVLPAAATDDLMLAIGCYQIPMYLTPLVLPRLLPRRARPAGR